ncbi:MAG: ATP-binding cassette domain-containing protein [Candidatus Bipolaricaulota bacterium]|nr:MAG: ATP-binding cassette domain-containing protein [Candidatus Bipolaricaulota bacterium]
MSSSSTPALATDGLTVRFPDRDRSALLGVTEAVPRGEVVALTGPSGCGKSTLLRTWAGFIPSILAADVQGTVRVGDLDPLHDDACRIAQQVGLVQQDPESQMCTLRVRQEVAFGPENLCLSEEEVGRRVREALRATAVEHLADRSTTTLSGGEKQRVAIASILAMEPDVLLLDEPTAHLDPLGADGLFETLGRLGSGPGLTLVVAEHRLGPLLPLQPRLLVMDRGQVVARRPTRRREDLLAMGLRLGWSRVARGERPSRPVVVLEEIRFDYGLGPVIEGLSLSAHEGEVLGVIGPNGGGKTTLLRLLARLLRPAAGTVRHAAVERIGMVFQHPHQQIFERSVRRELEIDGPLLPEDRDALLFQAHLEGMDDVPPLSLSLGEQRRLTLAAALRLGPRLVLLDEPFIGQDRHNVAWIIAQILEARDRGAAVVLVSHDIPLVAALSDRVLYLDRDPILGETEDVFCALREREVLPFTPEYWAGDR